MMLAFIFYILYDVSTVPVIFSN